MAGTVYRAELEPRRRGPLHALSTLLAGFSGHLPAGPEVADIVIASLRTGRELRRIPVRSADAAAVLARLQRDLDEQTPSGFAHTWRLERSGL